MFGSRDPISRLVALHGRARGEAAARLRLVVLLLLLAELQAAGAHNPRRPRSMRRATPRPLGRRGRRPARGSQTGRRPRG